MQYLLLIYDSESRPIDAEVEQAEIGEYIQLSKELGDSGKLLGGEALQPTSTATTVRVRDGKTMTTDGPFAETKEQLGGFYLIDADDLDHATAVAARIPGARHGCVEVRPIIAIPT